MFSTEGNMVIKEGSNSNYVEDYHYMELAVINTSNNDFLGNIASETYTSSIFYINMGFTFAAALAWNEAVKFFINQSKN